MNMEIDCIMKHDYGNETGNSKDGNTARGDKESGSDYKDGDAMNQNEGDRSEQNDNNTSGSDDNSGGADDNDDKKSHKKDNNATDPTSSDSESITLLEYFKTLIKTNPPDINLGADINRDSFEEVFSLPLLHGRFFFLHPCMIGPLLCEEMLWDVVVIDTMIYYFLSAIDLPNWCYIHPHVIRLPQTKDPSNNRWQFEDDNLPNIFNEVVKEAVNNSEVAFIFVITKSKGGDDGTPNHIGLIEVNNNPQVRKTSNQKKFQWRGSLTFYDPYEATDKNLVNILLRKFGEYLCSSSEYRGAFFQKTNRQGILRENSLLLSRVQLRDSSDNSCAAISFDRLLESLKCYEVEIPKNLGEDSTMYPSHAADIYPIYAANYKIKMALRLIQFLNNTIPDGVDVAEDTISSHSYDLHQATIVKDSPSKFSKVALSRSFTKRVVDEPNLLIEYAGSRCPCDRHLHTSDSRVTCTNCFKEYHTPCFLELFECFKNAEEIVCYHCNHTMSEDKPPVFQSPNVFNTSGTPGKIVTETFTGTIALNDPKESALRDVMMSKLRERTTNFRCSFSGMDQTDIEDLSMLCFLCTPYIDQHLSEQSIQELLKDSDEDLGRVLHEHKSFFPRLCAKEITKENCVDEMRRLRSLISSYNPVDIDRRLTGNVNNIKDQSFWIMTIAFAGMFNSLDVEKFVLEEAISDCGLRQSFMSMNERVKYEGKIFRDILVDNQFEESIQLQLFRVLWDFVHRIPTEHGQDILTDVRKWEAYQKLSDYLANINREKMKSPASNVMEENDVQNENPQIKKPSLEQETTTQEESPSSAGMTNERKRTANDNDQNENPQKKKPKIDQASDNFPSSAAGTTKASNDPNDDETGEPYNKKARIEQSNNQAILISKIEYLENELRETKAALEKEKQLSQKLLSQQQARELQKGIEEVISITDVIVKVSENKKTSSGMKINKSGRELLGEDGATRKCYCCLSEGASSQNVSLGFVKEGKCSANILPTLLPVHCKIKRAQIKKHSDLLPEILDYLSIVSIRQTEVTEAEIEHVSGLLLLLAIMYPSPNRNATGADGRFELLRHLHKPFHDAEAITLDRVIRFISSWREYFDTQFDGHQKWWGFDSPIQKYQTVLGTLRKATSKQPQQLEVKALFHSVYKPVEGREHEALQLLKTSLNNKFTGKMLNCSELWVKRDKTHKHGRLIPIISKATKILTKIEQIIRDQIEEVEKDEDKFFADNELIDLRNKLADGITQTITEEIDNNELRTSVTNLMETTVGRFAWVIQQRLVSLRYIAKNAMYTCFGGCDQPVSDLDTDQCISWEVLSIQNRLTNALKEKKRKKEDELDFGDKICYKCLNQIISVND
jgi:hypothetical protein